MMMHAEGGTTSGSLINFKKGAFVAETSIKPLGLKYNAPFVSPSTGMMDGIYYYVTLPACIFSTA
jgi:hypothetical protein